MLNPIAHPHVVPRLEPWSVLNAIYLLGSGAALVLGIRLFVDVWRDVKAKERDGINDVPGDELVCNDFRLERWRLVKQAVVFVALWFPVFWHPVLNDPPDLWIYEFYRFCFAFIGFSLLKNSYTSLRFRRQFREQYARKT